MKNNQFMFDLNDQEKIIIDSEEPIEKAHCCTQSSIILLHNDMQTILSIDSIRENLYVFRTLLERGIEKSQLHKSITKDIGYLYNEYLQGKSGLAYEKVESNDYWVGSNYLVWSYTVATWLYNDANNNLIFEVTPIYPGSFGTYDSSIPSYQEWITSYKVIFYKKLPLNISQQWLDQTSALLQHIEQNIAKEK